MKPELTIKLNTIEDYANFLSSPNNIAPPRSFDELEDMLHSNPPLCKIYDVRYPILQALVGSGVESLMGYSRQDVFALNRFLPARLVTIVQGCFGASTEEEASAFGLVRSKRHSSIVRKIMGAIYQILVAEKATALEKIRTLAAMEKMVCRSLGYEYNDLIPSFDNYFRQNGIKKYEITFDELAETKDLTLRKKFSHLHSDITNLVLLKDELNGLREGLYESLRAQIDKLIAETDLAELYRHGLILLGLISEFQNADDDTAKTSLLYKYGLDCACHGERSLKYGIFQMLFSEIYAIKVNKA